LFNEEASMKRAVILALGVLAPLVTALAAGPWDGIYVYEQGLGKNPGGIALFVTHTLTINGSDCRIDAEGYQTNEHIRCKATANGDKLDVAFLSFKDGGQLDSYGNQKYKVNQPLFALTRQGNAIATAWQGYRKNDFDSAGPPTFRKK
jgi:hypothetical protein